MPHYKDLASEAGGTIRDAGLVISILPVVVLKKVLFSGEYRAKKIVASRLCVTAIPVIVYFSVFYNIDSDCRKHT